MKTSIIYASRHGTTEKSASYIANGLKNAGQEVHLVNLANEPYPSIEAYDQVIIGGSIHQGEIQKHVRQFYTANIEALLQKETGLFICCMLNDHQEEEFENAFLRVLKDYSKAKGIFGSEFIFEKMNLMEKLMVKAVAKTHKSTYHLNYDKMDRFVEAFCSN